MANEPGTVTLTFRSVSDRIQNRPLDWDVPMRDRLRDPADGEYVWRRIQYVFELPDPHGFPALAVVWTQKERVMLERYVDHAKRLAGTSLLGGKDRLSVSIAEDDSEDIDAVFSDPDVTAGFGTFLRQCYIPDEEASFSRVRKVLAVRVHALGDAALEDTLKKWRRAQAALRRQALEELIQERLVEEGVMPAESPGPDGNVSSNIVRAPTSPDQLLRAYWFADLIHWGDQRKALAALQRNPFETAWSDLYARKCAVEIGHLYIGFAVLVSNALGQAN
jgi:hypothetical protein